MGVKVLGVSQEDGEGEVAEPQRIGFVVVEALV
jgi:hypothetical protein